MRRNSNNGKNGRRGKIPIPVSVTLHNLCPKADEAQVQSQSKKWFRPEHAMSLLHHAFLEIAITPPEGVDDQEGKSDNSSEGGATDKIIFSSLAPSRTVSPTWNNLDECIEDYLALDSYLDSETGVYRYMKIRIWLLSAAEVQDTKSNNTQVKQAADRLLDINIHPTKLRRLAKVPTQLPLNSLIFTFSDGSIRATRALLDVIGDQDGSHADEHNKDEFGRFGDDVFRTLDQVTPVKNSSGSKGVKRERLEGSADVALLTKAGSEDSEDGGGTTLFSDWDQRQQMEIASVLHIKFAGAISDAERDDVDTERRHLELLVQLEEEGLEKEMASLKEEKTETNLLLEKSSKYANDLANLKGGIATEMQFCRQSEFFLEARRIKLLVDLRTIYPISFLRGEDRFCIRDLCIPMDIHSGVVTEGELSAALGSLCHLISLTSKYVSVQLRYRLFCNSSRSAIQEDGGAIYPLFQARVVEHDALDHAVLLLRRDVECILRSRDIEYQPRDHILVNVNRFFDVMIDRTN